ncbi:MAG: amidohydrolase family protein [Candidatus Omnitrophica bacterium]|nr:amidohydrolase family protein [Candidatus Omnitrophota bacterium]
MGINGEILAEEKAYDYVIKGALVFDGESLVPKRQDLAISGDLQGVTTEVIGNCGMSAAPVEGPHTGEIAAVWRREGVEIPSELPWKSFKEYVNESEFQGLETNFAGLVGHGNLRSSVMGMAPRAATSQEIESMRALLGEALDQGAFGISFGLVYLPGIFASREELVRLCTETAKHDGLCVFHIRGEGKGLVEAVREAVEIGKAAKARIHISHLKAAGQNNWPKIDEAFQVIESARAEGLSVTADAYPYTASFAELGVVLPDELYQDPNRLNRLKDPVEKKKILEKLEAHYRQSPVSWDKIRVATVAGKRNFTLQGKSLAEIAALFRKSPVEMLIDLLTMEEFKVSAFFHSQSEAVVEKVFSKPYVAVGSDSIADGSVMPHPRAYGAFPKRLASCSKAGPVGQSPCWGRTIHQMTGLPAKMMGLRERGRLGTGLFADLVLFDPALIRDGADYKNPKVPPEGIEWVFVNGKPVVQKGRYQPVHSGLFLTPQR